MWITWIAYAGLIVGVVAASLFRLSILKSAVAGFVGGVVLVVAVNYIVPTAPPCLQHSKGWDVLRAYSLNCPKQQ